MRWSVINICLLCHLGPISQTSSSPRSNSMEINSTPTSQRGTLWSSIFAWSLGSYRKFTCSLVSWLGTHICVIGFMIPIDLCLVRAAFGFLLPQIKSVDGTFMFFAFLSFVSYFIGTVCFIKSPWSGVTLCFQFVSTVSTSSTSASTSAKTFPSHVKTVWAKPFIFCTKNIWVWGNILDDLSMTLTPSL